MRKQLILTLALLHLTPLLNAINTDKKNRFISSVNKSTLQSTNKIPQELITKYNEFQLVYNEILDFKKTNTLELINSLKLQLIELENKKNNFVEVEKKLSDENQPLITREGNQIYLDWEGLLALRTLLNSEMTKINCQESRWQNKIDNEFSNINDFQKIEKLINQICTK